MRRSFAVSSGTTAGRTKYLPVTEEMLAHFRKAGLDSLLYYTARVGHTGRDCSAGIFFSAAPPRSRPIEEAKPAPAYAGDLSGIAALNLPRWAEKHLYEPGADIAQINDWPAKLAAIAERTLRRDITLLAGIPSWVLIAGRGCSGRAPPASRLRAAPQGPLAEPGMPRARRRAHRAVCG